MDFEIVLEVDLFFWSAVTGMGLMAAYDLIRAWRRLVVHRKAAVVTEDILFWILAAVTVFLLLFFQNDGVVRGYVIVGVGIGMVVFEVLFGRWFIKFVNFLLKPLQNLRKKYRIKKQKEEKKPEKHKVKKTKKKKEKE